MDREIDTRTRYRAQLKRLIVPAAVIASMGLLLSWGTGLLRPSIKRSSIRTAVVDQGPVDASLSATGTVVPQTEQVLSSPVDARLLRVVRKAGTAVNAGDPIVDLDVSASVLAVESLGQDLALKANQQARSKLALENTLSELNAQFEIKTLQLESARLEHERKKQLFAEGLTSAEDLRRADVAERQAAIELQRIEASRRNAQESTKTELAGLSLELAKVEKAHQEARRVLGLATPTADRNGVVTWTLSEEGAAVGKGDIVARVADLSAFRVDASVSDAYASRLSTGLPVQIRVDDRVLDGHVTDVLPTVQNGVITVRVALKDPSHAALRPNLRVEVFIVTDHRDRALRVRKGSSTSGEGVQQVFVARGDRALRTRVRFGIASSDYVEVAEGLAAGDEVIVSDMADYQHLSSIRIR
ncbi:MAG: HlyD family efflux transporter periplasmic adaptor subunit [Vicinamibacterales bacterium]